MINIPASCGDILFWVLQVYSHYDIIKYKEKFRLHIGGQCIEKYSEKDGNCIFHFYGIGDVGSYRRRGGR